MAQHADPWPFFGLTITAPGLELRYATDELLLELAAVSGDVVRPGTRPFDGDATFYDPSPAGRRRWLAGQWAARARTAVDWWVLAFAVVVDGRAVGAQEMTAANFPALRTVETFSWLTRSQQGRGFGRQMRESVLHLAFDGLGAYRARSEAFEDNEPSCSVSRALGYERDGTSWTLREGTPAPMTRFLLTREAWLERRTSGMTIRGLEPCLPLLGLA